MIDHNEFDDITKTLVDGLDFLKTTLNKIGDKELTKTVTELMDEGVDEFNNNSNMADFRKKAKLFKKKTFEKHEKDIEEFKKWQ